MIAGKYEKKIAIISVASAFITFLISFTEFVSAQSPNGDIFPIDSRPYNLHVQAIGVRSGGYGLFLFLKKITQN